MTDELKAELVAGVQKELESKDGDTLTRRRDTALVEMIKSMTTSFGRSH